jgi:hypothetical protein
MAPLHRSSAVKTVLLSALSCTRSIKLPCHPPHPHTHASVPVCPQ